MTWSDYWGALALRQRFGVLAGVLLIVAGTAALAAWLLHDPYVPLASSLSAEQLNELTQNLDRAKLSYRIGPDADTVDIERSQLGKARAAMASGQSGVPASVGLELFKETDFSSTDFAQRINYQRALQGELTRTIQTISGVRSARVHVILADSGVFKRDAAKASAAVSIALQPGKTLAPSQVRGIQRLVAASVPEIRVDDVVVLDESGTSLTRAASESDGELSSAQLDLKREADRYLEGKLSRLLQDLLPGGNASLSVDTVLDYRQLRVTTDEPVAATGSKDAERATGVIVKEHRSERGRPSGLLQARQSSDSDDSDNASVDSEYEYSVGHRIEQTLSAPGSIKRVSVAVALQGAPAELSETIVEQLVTNAIGIDRSRGDSVSVLLLPATRSPAPQIAPEALQGPEPRTPRPLARKDDSALLFVAAVALTALIAAAISFLRRAPREAGSEVDVEAVASKVRQWLNEGATNGRS